MKKLLFTLLSLSFTPSSFAFTCFLTQMKDNCWTAYNINVDVYDASNDQKLVSIIVPTGKSWARQQFTCQPGQNLRFQVQFTPVFWQSDEGKTWYGDHFWELPPKIKPGETAWDIPLCFPAQFAEVPMPPQAGNNCQCDSSNIPPVEAPQN